MADRLPRAPNVTKEGRELNSRIELVVYPADVKIKNSMNLPVLTDRERVVVNLSYSKGPAVRNIRVVDSLSQGRQYQKGSGLFRGKAREPKVKDDALTWELGDIGAESPGDAFVCREKREKGVSPVPGGQSCLPLRSQRCQPDL